MKLNFQNTTNGIYIRVRTPLRLFALLILILLTDLILQVINQLTRFATIETEFCRLAQNKIFAVWTARDAKVSGSPDLDTKNLTSVSFSRCQRMEVGVLCATDILKNLRLQQN